VVYVRLIPPGAADVVHYRLKVPANVGKQIKLQARLCYRKFSWYNTHFSYAGILDPAITKQAPAAPDFDDRKFVFPEASSDVAGNLKKIPDLPITVLSENEVFLDVLPASAAVKTDIRAEADDWTRWNDYGIGLFLQGDFKGARQAFEQIIKVDPKNPDGWVNLGRVALQEGNLISAREVLQKALQLKPDLARTHYFFARLLRQEGKYDEAAGHLQKVVLQYPKDRVVLNDLARIYFLKRRYSDAVVELRRVLDIDPEDLQAHYTLMLCYRGMNRTEEMQQEEKLYSRFKADEPAQSLTGAYRRIAPEDNNERQAIHEHTSMPLSRSSKHTVSLRPNKTMARTQKQKTLP
jgi:cytochrome c-type biogenesis protein CcmH/NrfG